MKNIRKRITDFLDENYICYEERFYDTDDEYMSWELVIGGGHLYIYRVDRTDYALETYDEEENLINCITFTASMFREVIERIKKELEL